MYYFLLVLYILSFFVSYHYRVSFYRRMAWDKVAYRRPYEYTGHRFRDTFHILIISLVPLLNTINALEMLSRQDEFRKMVEESRQWRENHTERKTP